MFHRPNTPSRAGLARLGLTLAIACAGLQSAAAQINITIGGQTQTIPTAQADQPSRERPGPALWSIRDEDSVIYLFGTVHMLDGETAWRTRKVETAFTRSQELWLEIAEADDPQAMAVAAAPVVQRLGLDQTTRLSSRLTPAELQRFRTAAALIGAAPQQIDAMKPWLAAMTLSVAPLVRAGYNPSMGVDAVLARAARAQNKPVHGLETAAGQVGILGGLPMPIQMQMLRSTLTGVDEAPAQMRALLEAWADGDASALEAGFIDQMRRDSPEFYRAFMVDRNRAWVGRIEERMKGAGVTFVAVGAAHLVGPDSVQALLAARGLTARAE